MPLYLVRWPWLTASLVSARDEDELLDTLDQVADTEGATWSVYRGPIWIDFQLAAEYRVEGDATRQPLTPNDIVVGDVTGLNRGLQPGIPECDQTSSMEEAVVKKAFGRLHHVMYETADEPSKDDLRNAIREELNRLLTAEWRRAGRGKRKDGVATIANALGAPVRQVENVLRDAGEPSRSVLPVTADVHRLRKRPPKRTRK